MKTRILILFVVTLTLMIVSFVNSAMAQVPRQYQRGYQAGTPAISPYFNYFRGNTGGIPQYYQFVQPRMQFNQAQATLNQQQQRINILQNQSNVQQDELYQLYGGATYPGSPYGAIPGAVPGRQGMVGIVQRPVNAAQAATFMNTAQFYAGLNRGAIAPRNVNGGGNNRLMNLGILNPGVGGLNR